MTTTALNRLASTITIAASALLGACAENGPVEPRRTAQVPTSATTFRAPALPAGCEKLAAPATTKLAFHVYAEGVQIYRWTGAAWSFVAPEATLFANAAGSGVVGTHYEGPKWESNSGGIVAGSVKDRCTPNPNAIAWLSLNAVAEGPGIFGNVVFIQRVNTVAGKEPTSPGTFVGQQARVPYTTEYYFYRAR
jgi:hypothetical protein